MCPVHEETKQDNEEKVIKLAENDYVIILSVPDKKQFFPFLIPDTTENNFIRNILQASTLNHENKNPGFEVGRAIEVTPLRGSKPILHAKVSSTKNKHRVILITQHIHAHQLDKLVILLLRDDPDHELNLDSIKESHKQKGYDCGSKQHWSRIIQAIKNKHYQEIPSWATSRSGTALPSKQASAAESKEKPTASNLNSNRPIAGVEKAELPDMTEDLLLQDNVAPLPQNVAEATQDPSVAQPTPELESAEICAQQAPKKKTRNRKKTSSGFIPTEEHSGIFGKCRNHKEFGELIKKVLLVKNGHETLLDFLDSGMNPNICLDDLSLLRLAVYTLDVKIVELLLERGASLTYTSKSDGKQHAVLSFLAQFEKFFSKKEDRKAYAEILHLLVRKSKEDGTLHALVPPQNTFTILETAITACNLIAVEELCKQGASSDIPASHPSATIARKSPLEFGRAWLAEAGDTLNTGDKAKLHSILKILQPKENISIAAMLALMRHSITIMEKGKVEEVVVLQSQPTAVAETSALTRT